MPVYDPYLHEARTMNSNESTALLACTRDLVRLSTTLQVILLLLLVFLRVLESGESCTAVLVLVPVPWYRTSRWAAGPSWYELVGETAAGGGRLAAGFVNSNG
jgi:hypothetical protein